MKEKKNTTDIGSGVTNSSSADANSASSISTETEPLNAKIAELTNDLQRTRADFENYRKQMDAQKAQAAEFARLDTIRKFLPLIDDMDRAIIATPELKPLEKTFEKTLATLGLSKIESETGTAFNPDLHDAVSMEEGEGETEVVAETLRTGYLYNGQVLRPAMVKVSTK